MKILEYQAKELFAQYGIAVPKGFVATTPDEVAQRVTELSGKAVVKAQVHAGGRGKAGGVKVVNSPEEGKQFAAGLLGSRLVTHQTGPEGVPVDKVLVEELITIKKELYCSLLVDPTAQMPVLIASEAGGMEIEEVAVKSPEKIIQIAIDPVVGLQPFMGRKLGYALNLAPELLRNGGALATSLYRMFNALDCSLVEINPLVITGDNRLLAADGKINFDDDALFRHPELPKLRDLGQEDPLDVKASESDVNYIRLDGDVGCMVNGAGLAMGTMDIIKYLGASPANFLDVGGGASVERVATAFQILMQAPALNSVLINIFGGIVRCDRVAKGIIEALQTVEVTTPVTVRLQGTNAEEGRKLLQESSLEFIVAATLDEAARKAVEAGR